MAGSTTPSGDGGGRRAPRWDSSGVTQLACARTRYEVWVYAHWDDANVQDVQRTSGAGASGGSRDLLVSRRQRLHPCVEQRPPRIWHRVAASRRLLPWSQPQGVRGGGCSSGPSGQLRKHPATTLGFQRHARRRARSCRFTSNHLPTPSPFAAFAHFLTDTQDCHRIAT